MRPSTSLVLVATVLSGLTGVYGAAIPAYEPNISIIHEPLHAKQGENYVRSDLTQTEADLEREDLARREAPAEEMNTAAVDLSEDPKESDDSHVAARSVAEGGEDWEQEKGIKPKNGHEKRKGKKGGKKKSGKKNKGKKGGHKSSGGEGEDSGLGDGDSEDGDSEPGDSGSGDNSDEPGLLHPAQWADEQMNQDFDTFF